MPRKSLKFVLAFAAVGAALSLQPNSHGRFTPEVNTAHAWTGDEYCDKQLGRVLSAEDLLRKTQGLMEEGSSKQQITDAICEDLRDVMWGTNEMMTTCARYTDSEVRSGLSDLLDVLKKVNDDYCGWRLGF